MSHGHPSQHRAVFPPAYATFSLKTGIDVFFHLVVPATAPALLVWLQPQSLPTSSCYLGSPITGGLAVPTVVPCHILNITSCISLAKWTTQTKATALKTHWDPLLQPDQILNLAFSFFLFSMKPWNRSLRKGPHFEGPHLAMTVEATQPLVTLALQEPHLAGMEKWGQHVTDLH